MEDLTLRDILFIFFLPYILVGYLLLCIVCGPIECLVHCLRRWS